jgi:hypothetical protein
MESDFAQLKMLLMMIFAFFIVVINDKTPLLCHGFQLAVDVMDESNKCGRSIRWAKRHDGICPFDNVWALTGELFLTG